MNLNDDLLEGPLTQRRPVHAAPLDIGELASEDFGLVCHACGTVTIFSVGAARSPSCSRCFEPLASSSHDEERITFIPASS